MPLTPAQQLIVKNFVEADATLNQIPHTSDGAFELASLLSLPFAQSWIVWKSKVTQDEITQNGFAWVEVDNLVIGKARIWEWMFLNATRSINPSKPNVRAGIIECWSGNAARVAVQVVVLGHCKRPANIIEKILSTGTGSDASPATMSFEGSVGYSDIFAAMGWT